MKPLSIELREQIIAGYESGMTYKEVSERLEVSISTIRKLVRLIREMGSVKPRPHGGGKPWSLKPAQQQTLRCLIGENPTLHLHELVELLVEVCSIRVSKATIMRELNKMGIETRKRPRLREQTSELKRNKVYAKREKPDDYSGPRKAYPSDLTDAEWALLEPLLPKAKSGGRPAERSKREIVNGIAYVLRSGCSWRMLPHDFPPWSTVYDYFREWRNSALWQEINDYLREKVRSAAGKQPTPSGAIVDSQSARTTEKGGPVATMVESA